MKKKQPFPAIANRISLAELSRSCEGGEGEKKISDGRNSCRVIEFQAIFQFQICAPGRRGSVRVSDQYGAENEPLRTVESPR